MLMAQAGLNVVGGLLASVMWLSLQRGSLKAASVVSLATGILGLILLSRRKAPLSDLSSSVVFAVSLFPAYWILWSSDAALAVRHESWVPFQPHELACLAIAIMAPKVRWIGIPAILAVPLLATTQYFGLTPEQVDWLPVRPLLAPIAFAAFAVVLYLFRLRGLRVAELAARKEAEARMMTELTRKIMAIKDLANSPVQALIVDAELLKARHPDDPALARRIRKATRQLEELNHILDERVRADASGPVRASLDSYEELRPSGAKSQVC
jgi:hypothetical protein